MSIVPRRWGFGTASKLESMYDWTPLSHVLQLYTTVGLVFTGAWQLRFMGGFAAGDAPRAFFSLRCTVTHVLDTIAPAQLRTDNKCSGLSVRRT